MFCRKKKAPSPAGAGNGAGRGRRSDLERDQPGIGDGLDATQRLQHRVGNLAVELNHGQSRAGMIAAGAAQSKVADVELVLAENCSDAADDARHVEIAEGEQLAFERGLDRPAPGVTGPLRVDP